MLKTDDKLTIDNLLDEKNAAMVALAKRQKLGELIDKYVLSQPRGPERWRAAVNLWINMGDMYVTPGLTAEQENKAVIRANRDKKLLLKNKYGFMSDSRKVINGGGESDIREALSMPFGAHMFISLVDPEIKTKENTYKLMKEFREYCVPEAI